MKGEIAEDAAERDSPAFSEAAADLTQPLALSSGIGQEFEPHGLPRLVVMIPSFNEEQTIARVVSAVPRNVPGIGGVMVVVIDDGSEDGTAEAADGAGADVVIHHKTNLGLGRAFKNGLEMSLRLSADIIVNIDGDGQYDATEIPDLVEPILEGRADIVLGDRQIAHRSHMSRSRRWGNRMASWVMRRLSGIDVRDSQTGFRALTRETALRLTLGGAYTYTQEMIIQAAHRGLAIVEVPVSFHRRPDGDSRLFTSIWRYAGRSGAIILRSYRDHNPLRLFTIIGLGLLFLSGLLGLRVIVHFFATGMVTPFLPTAILAAILGVVAIQVLIFGFVADMIKTHRELSEEALLRIRRLENGPGDSEVLNTRSR